MTNTETVKEDINKNEKVLKNSKTTNKKSANKMANNESNIKETESYENGKNETDKVVNVEKDITPPAEEMATPTNPEPEETSKIEQPTAPVIYVPKYKYSEGLSSFHCKEKHLTFLLCCNEILFSDQWSPLNTAGKKCYDIDLLKQIKEDPLSKNKPNVPLLEHCNVIRVCIHFFLFYVVM